MTRYELYDNTIQNAWFDKNSFLRAVPSDERLPDFQDARRLLPEPGWAGHASTIEAYWKAWEIAFSNLKAPTPDNGFVSNYIDTAFNNCLFMWDSCFILQFGRYGDRAFNFQKTLDNLYARQHRDGFICREISEASGADRFHRYDPSSTGPNLLAWSELSYFRQFGDIERLRRVYPVLTAFHLWLKQFRTWPDGGYFSSGWGCGMDNQPRQPPGYHPEYSHGHMVWADTCFQQILNANCLAVMADLLGASDLPAEITEEREFLLAYVNKYLWDEKSGFYFDLWRNGQHNGVKTVGAFWALLADAVPADRLDRFAAHLDNEKEFRLSHRVPSLAADHPLFESSGGYWRGSVWAPATYMVLKGLRQRGYGQMAHEIALNHVGNVVRVFENTGTFWENYSPKTAAPGRQSIRDFVGWTGLSPIAVLFEDVFGIQQGCTPDELIWDIRLTESHEVRRYPFGAGGLADLICESRTTVSEKPRVRIKANQPLKVRLVWENGEEEIMSEYTGGISYGTK